MPGSRLLAVCFCLIAHLALTQSSSAASGPVLRVATTGDHSELIRQLPIARGGRSKPRVVMSLPVRRVGGLERGDALRLSAELQLTTDCDEHGPRCLGDPYHYNPRVTTYAVLASSPNATGGSRSVQLAAAASRECRQSKPNREHHCVLVRNGHPRRIGSGAACLQSRCYVNLVAGANARRAHAGEYLAVGGLRPDGSVPQDRGRLNVIRIVPAGNPRHRTQITTRPVSTSLRLNQERGSLLARRLAGLRRGDQLIVAAAATVNISRLPYNVVLSSQLIVTDRRGDLVRGRAASFVSSRGELDEGNGFNCTQNKGTCTIRKVGVLTVKRSPTRSGKPMPLFVSLVTRAGPKHQRAAPGDRVLIRGGALRVARYPSSER